ncbi:MAG TPA: alginate export family protein, partial [Verrucomicrobiae bacterium]|nr:alginate export family protein [Verrucomicrobiae bacterium]
PNFTLKLSHSVSVDGGANWMWRYTRNDAVCGVPGYVEIPALQNASSFIATAVDLNLQWQIQKHLAFGASYVHFFTGSYVHTSGGSDVDYVSTTLTFLF